MEIIDKDVRNNLSNVLLILAYILLLGIILFTIHKFIYTPYIDNLEENQEENYISFDESKDTFDNKEISFIVIYPDSKIASKVFRYSKTDQDLENYIKEFLLKNNIDGLSFNKQNIDKYKEFIDVQIKNVPISFPTSYVQSSIDTITIIVRKK